MQVIVKTFILIQIIFIKKMVVPIYLGFRSALTRVLNKYATEHNLLKKNKLTISGDDIKEGLTCVIISKNT